jgi:hypothetical protein
VVKHAVAMRLTKIDIIFAMEADRDLTLVNEHIMFKSPLPIKYMVMKIFKKQHKMLFENIQNAE